MSDFSNKPPADTPILVDGQLSQVWSEWFRTVGEQLDETITDLSAKLDASTFTQQPAVSQASDVDTPVLTAGSDSIDLTDANTKLATLATQINLLKTVVNAIITALVAGGELTS